MVPEAQKEVLPTLEELKSNWVRYNSLKDLACPKGCELMLMLRAVSTARVPSRRRVLQANSQC